MQKNTYFHSPFSEVTVLKGTNRFLLVQFILTEIFQSVLFPEGYINRRLGPIKTLPRLSLSLFFETSSFSRMQEHATLLSFAFPKKKAEAAIFSHVLSLAIHRLQNAKEKTLQTREFETELKTHLQQMIFLLEPFIEECKNDESFLFFLLNHHKEISLLCHFRHLHSLLDKLHPQGLNSLQEYICDYFHEKGFPYLIHEVKSLIELLNQGENYD